MVLAIRPGPPQPDFFNCAAFEMISKLTGTQRTEVHAAFQQMFELIIEREGNIGDMDLDRVLPEPEILPPARALKAAS
jgi:hypothetical protein